MSHHFLFLGSSYPQLDIYEGILNIVLDRWLTVDAILLLTVSLVVVVFGDLIQMPLPTSSKSTLLILQIVFSLALELTPGVHVTPCSTLHRTRVDGADLCYNWSSQEQECLFHLTNHGIMA